MALHHRAIDAFNRRDLDAFLELMDADVEAVSLLAGIEGGYHGHAGIRRWWENLLDAFPDFVAKVVEVRDLGDETLMTAERIASRRWLLLSCASMRAWLSSCYSAFSRACSESETPSRTERRIESSRSRICSTV